MNLEPRTSNVERRIRWLRVVRSALGVLAAGMILSVSSGAQDTNTYPPFDSFKIIKQRNIFDPNRYRRDTTYQPQTNRNRLNAFALVGTMSYSKGRFAFFDGTSSQYKKVVEPGGNMAGYTVKEVTQDAVTLAANGKEFQMKVGTQMRNQGNNKWLLAGQIIEDTAADETNGETNGESAAVNSSAPPAGGSPETSDILKKMAERRKQEIQ